MKAGNYEIKWCYVEREVRVGVPKDITLSTTDTRCFIYNNDQIVAFGYALCHPKDNFNKDIGRKLSLTRTLKNMEFSKEDRKLIWEAYRNMKKGGRW